MPFYVSFAALLLVGLALGFVFASYAKSAIDAAAAAAVTTMFAALATQSIALEVRRLVTHRRAVCELCRIRPWVGWRPATHSLHSAVLPSPGRARHSCLIKCQR